MKSTIHGVRSFDRSPTTLLKTFLVDWCDFIQQNWFNLTQIHSERMKRLVIAEHRRSYPDPIEVKKGEAFSLSGREEIWDGHKWLWAQSEDGREGWVPDDLLEEDNGKIVAAYDYSALELTAVPGDQVEVLRESHGWMWCKNGQGETGWLPRSVLDHA